MLSGGGGGEGGSREAGEGQVLWEEGPDEMQGEQWEVV